MLALWRLAWFVIWHCWHVQSGKTEYKSVTVAENATAEEFVDFYLDDPSRHTWVQYSHDLLTFIAFAAAAGATLSSVVKYAFAPKMLVAIKPGGYFLRQTLTASHHILC